MPVDPAEARFPSVPAARGHYESFYLRACHPSERLGVWIRYTVHKRPGKPLTGSVWFTLFDDAADGPVASKVTLQADDVRSGGDTFISLGRSTFGRQAASGSAHSEHTRPDWSLTYESDAPPLTHLPRDWMYRAPIPRTKLTTPSPAATFHGHVDLDGRRIQVDGWRGMVGHNWGSQHAERWVWMHGLDMSETGPSWLDVAIGRVKLGPVTTPWIANGAVWLDGRLHRVGGPAVRGTKIEERSDGCAFSLPGGEVTLSGEVSAPHKDFVAWLYADPDGPEHNALNCSIAQMRVSVHGPRVTRAELSTDHCAAYELGTRATDHGVPVQPFPDG
ncbi:MAG: hypothetical protein JOZ25_04485 [Actinobacteria bacterium]|nr:hypothetical protein [Actinomycetota bacterium]